MKTGLNCYRITPAKAERLWVQTQATIRNFGSIIKDGHVYTLFEPLDAKKARHGEYVCFEAETGKLVVSIKKYPLRNYQSAVAIGDYLLAEHYSGKTGGLRETALTPVAKALYRL